MTADKSLFLRRPCLYIQHESPNVARAYWFAGFVALPWNWRIFRPTTKIIFRSESECSLYYTALQHICPNLQDGEAWRPGTKAPWTWHHCSHVEDEEEDQQDDGKDAVKQKEEC